jgi:O-antigen ligase
MQLLMVATIGVLAYMLGGSMFMGLPIMASTVLVSLTVVCWAFQLLFEKDAAVRLNLWSLIFLPFLLYLYYNLYFVSKTPWRGEIETALWLQCTCFFMLFLNWGEGRNALKWIVVGMYAVMSVSIGIGLYYFWYAPDWLPLNRLKAVDHIGRLSGTFGIPNTLAAVLLLIMPILWVYVRLPRLKGYWRLLCGGLALLFMGAFLMTASRGGLIGLSVILLLLPWFWFEKKRHRLQYFGGLCILIALGVITLLWVDVKVEQRVVQAIHEQGERTRPMMWKAAWQIFADNPVFGTGLGSYRLEWYHYRPEGALIDPQFAHSDILEMFSNLGLLGGGLFYGALALVLFTAFKKWQSISFREISFDSIYRESSQQTLDRIREAGMEKTMDSKRLEAFQQGLGSGKKRRHNRQRDKGVLSGQKQVMGAVLLGFTGFLVHLCVDFHLRIPVVCFILILVLAFLLRQFTHRSITFYLDGWRKPAMIGGLMALSLWVFHTGFFSAYGAWHYFNGEECLIRLSLSENRPTNRYGLYSETEYWLEQTLEFQPKHAEAIYRLGRLNLTRAGFQPGNLIEIGQTSALYFDAALKYAPDYCAPMTYMGVAYAYMDADRSEVLPWLRKGIEAAPNYSTSWHYLGWYLSMCPDMRDEALKSLERALTLDPKDEITLDLRARLLLR